MSVISHDRQGICAVRFQFCEEAFTGGQNSGDLKWVLVWMESDREHEGGALVRSVIAHRFRPVIQKSLPQQGVLATLNINVNESPGFFFWSLMLTMAFFPLAYSGASVESGSVSFSNSPAGKSGMEAGNSPEGGRFLQGMV